MLSKKQGFILQWKLTSLFEQVPYKFRVELCGLFENFTQTLPGTFL